MTKRPISDRLDQIIGEKIPVLDHGFVLPLDYCGNDDKIVQAARQSYGSGKKVRNTRGLIRYLVRHGHMSPLEQCSITFLLKVPIFVARQIVRHRTAKLSELSGRYSDLPPEYYVPDPQDLHRQHTTRRQGRDEDNPLPAKQAHEVLRDLRVNSEAAFESYQQHEQKGLAREVARIGLPLSTYTVFYWTMDLRNLLHFLELRMDDHAQLEIRLYADAIAEIVTKWVPITYQAFLDYRVNRMVLSGLEVEVLQQALANTDVLYPSPDVRKWPTGEQRAFGEKLGRLGVGIGYQYNKDDLAKATKPDDQGYAAEGKCRMCGCDTAIKPEDAAFSVLGLCRYCIRCPWCAGRNVSVLDFDQRGFGVKLQCFGCGKVSADRTAADLRMVARRYRRYEKPYGCSMAPRTLARQDVFRPRCPTRYTDKSLLDIALGLVYKSNN